MEQEMSLRGLPAEVLGSITSYVTLADIFRLWACGDGLFITKLRNGGVVEAVSPTSDSIPFVAQFLRLRRWKCISKYIKYEHATSYLAMLPPTVQHITWGVHIPPFDLSQHFPQLTTLYGIGLAQGQGDWTHLPITTPLTSFMASRVPLKTLALLPSTLTSLEVQLTPNEASAWVDYPLYDEEENHYRFPNLKTLHIRGAGPTLKMLPPTLTSLGLHYGATRDVFNTGDYHFKYIPPSLETFIFSAVNSHTELAPIEIEKYFPSSLRQLAFLTDFEWTDDHVRALPKNLVTLCLANSTSRNPILAISDAAILPPGLTSLTARVSEDRGRSILDWTYPPHLKTLSILPCHLECKKLPSLSFLHAVNLYPHQFAQLPPTLTKLDCSVFPTLESVNQPWMGERHVSPLPMGITSLNAKLWVHMTLHGWLPSTLTFLSLIGGENSPLPTNWLDALPPTLHTLQFLDYFAILNDEHLEPLARLPYLKRFCFYRRPGAVLPKPPEGLTTRCVLHLPPKIEIFEVSTSCATMDESCFDKLPKSLQALRFRSEDPTISWSCSSKLLDLLPPNLTRFAIPLSGDTLEAISPAAQSRGIVLDSNFHYEGFDLKQRLHFSILTRFHYKFNSMM